jgi:hypothetical protein
MRRHLVFRRPQVAQTESRMDGAGDAPRWGYNNGLEFNVGSHLEKEHTRRAACSRPQCGNHQRQLSDFSAGQFIWRARIRRNGVRGRTRRSSKRDPRWILEDRPVSNTIDDR